MKTRTFSVIAIALIALIVVVTATGLLRTRVNDEDKVIVNKIERGFDAKATFKLKDIVMVGDVNRTVDGAMTVKITEPKHLNGMTFSYDGKDVTVSYLGMKLKLDEDTKLVSGAAQALISAINKATSKTGLGVKLEKKTLTLIGESDSGEFKLIMDRNSGSILAVKMDDLDFECSFDEFIFK